MVIRHADDAGVHTTRHVLDSAEEIFTLPVSGDLRWCYANADEIGYYRQHLNAALLTKILANLEQLNPSEQIGLLADQWALTRSGRQNIAQFLDVLTELAARSDNYNLLFEIVGHLHTLERMVEDIGVAAVVDHFRGWVTRLFKIRLEALGFEPQPGEATETLQQRISAVNAMTKLARQPQAVKQVRHWAEREAQDPRVWIQIWPPHLSPSTRNLATRGHSRSMWTFTWSAKRTAPRRRKSLVTFKFCLLPGARARDLNAQSLG